MKHRQHHSTRYAPHVQAVLDFVRRLSTAVRKPRPGRNVLIAFWIGARRLSIKVAAVLPKGVDANHYAAKECERVRARCAGHARVVT